jgi:hypothetical protein
MLWLYKCPCYAQDYRQRVPVVQQMQGTTRPAQPPHADRDQVKSGAQPPVRARQPPVAREQPVQYDAPIGKVGLVHLELHIA